MTAGSRMDVYSSVHTFQEEQIRNKVIVVVDVLRATSTIVTALSNGAKGVIPVEDMGEASRIAQSVDSSNILLCGEKDGVKIEGYDLGNSPFEYTRERVDGRLLILNTTNGTKAIKKSNQSSELYIASFLNLDAVVQRLREVEGKIVIVCSGWKGRLSLEDLLLAGNIIHDWSDGSLATDARDGARIAFTLYERYKQEIEKVILHSNHATRLRDLIGEEDIRYCCQKNTTGVLPVLNEGIITDRYAIQEV